MLPKYRPRIPALRMEDAVDERVGVGIVRAPAPDVHVRVCPAIRVHVLGHGLVGGPQREADLPESLRDLLEERGELAEEERVHRDRELDRLPRDCCLLSPSARRRPARRARTPLPTRGVAQQARRNEAVGRNREPPERAADHARHVEGRASLRAHVSRSFSGPRRVLKSDEVGLELGLSRYPDANRGSCRRASASAGSRSRRARAGPARNSSRTSSGGAPKRKTRPSLFGSPRASSAGCARARAACRARSRRRGKGPFRRRRPRSSSRPRRPLRDDRGRGVGDQGREERDRLLELDDELGRRDDVEPLEVRRLAASSFRALRGSRESNQRHSLSRVGEEPLEGIAHVARRQTPAVVEAHARAQPEPEARALGLREDFGGEPRDDRASCRSPRSAFRRSIGRTSACSDRRRERRIEAADEPRRPAPAGRRRRPARGSRGRAGASTFPISA